MLVDYDEIVREWAYRVPDGKPDLNNAYHKDKLIEVLQELNYPLDLLLNESRHLNSLPYLSNIITFSPSGNAGIHFLLEVKIDNTY